MVTNTIPLEAEEGFEGEETLGAEFRDKAPLDEAEPKPAGNIYPDGVLNIAPENLSVFELKRKRDKTPPRITLDPDFQRLAVWNHKQKSELIESILMGIPVPLIYVKEDDKGVYVIVDGRQRLATLFEFLNLEFHLQSLTVLKELNGAYFCNTAKNGTTAKKSLNQIQQGKIEDCQLTLHVIKPPTPDRITFDLFDRVNRGGTRLNNQEMRNALYQGATTRLLNKLTTFDSFKQASENSIKAERMKDKYLVLRLLAFYLWSNNQLFSVKEKGAPLVEYRSDIDDFLGKAMLFLNDEAGRAFCVNFPVLFDQAMNTCATILGPGCFRLPKKNNDGNRRPINMALFETIGYLVIELRDALPQKGHHVKCRLERLLSDQAFIVSTTYAVDSTKSVFERFRQIGTIIEEVRNA